MMYAGNKGPMAERPGEAGVEVVDPDRRLSARDAAWLGEMAVRALGVLGASGEVRVRVLGDQAMAAAHERYAGEPGTTDVLTFDLREGRRDIRPTKTPPADLDVDVLVCFDEARRQAERRGHEPVRELLLYVVHGVLHCLGHDDHDPAGAARMHAEEDRVLGALGIGPVYARNEGSEP